MAENILRTEKLSVGYGKSILINGIDISVKKGQIVTLIGPNGAGKSTILKSISTQLSVISGIVYINEKNIKGMGNREISRAMSIMMTNRIETELMTCYDVVKSGRYPYTGQLGILSDNDKKQVAQAMQLTAVEELADIDFSCISDGQRQRVMLAKAICQEPDILILDEPTSFLDIHHKLELLSILKNLVNEKNIGIIMSMHELDLAQRISDYVVCVTDNRIDMCGNVEDVFTDDYIKKLYNINNGEFYSKYGSVELERIDGTPKVFVIAGGGSGINIFRRLQRMGIPFAAGIIYENDIDYPVAKALSSELVEERAFESIDQSKVRRAIEIIEKCKNVICCIDHFGTLNHENRQLYEYAEKNGYLKFNSFSG